MRLTILIFLFFSLTYSLNAQDNTNLTHYFMNPYSINPSFAGTDGKPSLFLTYRKQWINIEGAPVIGNFSFHTPIGSKLGFGLNVSNAERSILNTTSAHMSFSYAAPLSDNILLRFGISGGAAYNGVDLEQVTNITDPELQALLLDNNIYITGNAGLSLQIKTLNLGVSIPNLFTDEYTSSESFSVGDVNPLENAILFVSNRFYFANDKHMFEPFVLYRYSDVLPPQIEASAAVHLNHLVWFGGSYKQDFGISAFGGIKLKKAFGVGYAYSLKNTGANELNSATHEIQLNLLLGARKSERKYYSFIDTEKPKKKTKKQLALEKKREEEEKKKEEEAKAKAEEEALAEAEAEAEAEREREKAERSRMAEAEADSDEVDDVDRESGEEVAEIAEERAEESIEENEDRIEDINERSENIEAEEVYVDATIEKTDRQNTDEKDQPITDTNTSVTADEPARKPAGNLIEDQFTNERVVVKRGNHMLELSEGEYVVVGAFSSYENAEKFSDDLFFKGYKTRFGYLTGKNLWYVYLYQGDDIEKARAERDKYRKTALFKKAWVITVQ